MRGKRALIGGIAVLIAVAGGALTILRRAQTDKRLPPGAPVAEVAIAPVVSLPGKIRAQTVIPVAAPVDGTFQELLVEAGERVYEGQLLGRIANTGLELDSQQAAAEVARTEERVNQLQNELINARLEASRARADASRAQADYERAERDFLRQQMLYKQGATPRLAYEKSQAEYQAQTSSRETLAEVARLAEDRQASIVARLDATRAALDEKKALLDRVRESAAAAEIRSPVDGLLLAYTRQVGEEVTTEVHDLFHIAVNLSALEAVVEPEPPMLVRVRPGQEALIQIAELANAIPGRVKEIQGAQVIVEFTSPDPSLLPGATAQVTIKLI
jgi:multidrug resistance efflux pump